MRVYIRLAMLFVLSSLVLAGCDANRVLAEVIPQTGATSYPPGGNTSYPVVTETSTITVTSTVTTTNTLPPVTPSLVATLTSEPTDTAPAATETEQPPEATPPEGTDYPVPGPETPYPPPGTETARPSETASPGITETVQLTETPTPQETETPQRTTEPAETETQPAGTDYPVPGTPYPPHGTETAVTATKTIEATQTEQPTKTETAETTTTPGTPTVTETETQPAGTDYPIPGPETPYPPPGTETAVTATETSEATQNEQPTQTETPEATSAPQTPIVTETETPIGTDYPVPGPETPYPPPGTETAVTATETSEATQTEQPTQTETVEATDTATSPPAGTDYPVPGPGTPYPVPNTPETDEVTETVAEPEEETPAPTGTPQPTATRRATATRAITATPEAPETPTRTESPPTPTATEETDTQEPPLDTDTPEPTEEPTTPPSTVTPAPTEPTPPVTTPAPTLPPGEGGEIPLPPERQSIQFPLGATSFTVNFNLQEGQVQAYQLEALAGQRMFITTNGNVRLQVYDPNGNRITGVQNAANPIQVPLFQSGNYGIALQGEGLGSLSVYIPPLTGNQTRPVPAPGLLQTIRFQTGESSTSFRVNAVGGTPIAYTLNALAGQQMMVITNGGATFALLAPDQSPVPSDAAPANQWSFSLPQSGDYTLILQGSGPVDVTIRIPPLSAPAPTATSQVPVTGNPIPIPANITRVSFSRGNASAVVNANLNAGTPQAFVLEILAGQTLFISTTGQVDVTIYGPGNQVLSNGHSDTPNRWSAFAGQTGDYIFVISGSSASRIEFYIPPR